MSQNRNKESFRELSDTHKCSVKGCGKSIKARLVRIKQRAPRYCYNHWIEIKRAQKARTK